MHSVTVFASLVSLAALARAQAGRFPCTAIIAGVPTANQNACTTLTATGLNQGVLPTDDKADGFTPVGSICVPDTATTFSCGFTNAPSVLASLLLSADASRQLQPPEHGRRLGV